MMVVVLVTVGGLENEQVFVFGVVGLASRRFEPLARLLQLLLRDLAADDPLERARRRLDRVVVLVLRLFLLLGTLVVELLELLVKGHENDRWAGCVNASSQVLP